MGNANRSANAATYNKRHHNRIGAILIHLERYWSMGASILAVDAGVSKSTISHLLRGKSHPLYSTARRVVKCLEREFGSNLDPDEVYSEDGSYPTTFVCALMGCPGCDDSRFFDRNDSVLPGLHRIERGRWTGDNFELEDISQAERST